MAAEDGMVKCDSGVVTEDGMVKRDSRVAVENGMVKRDSRVQGRRKEQEARRG